MSGVRGAHPPKRRMYIQFHWILLLARIVLGGVMTYYGWPKIRDLDATAQEFAQMGFKPSRLWGTLIAVVEFVGGIAVFLGLFAELAAALFGFQMMVGTFWKLKINKPFTDYSYDLQLFALCLILMAQGAGIFALAAFPGFIFLRWDVAAAALAAALLFAVLCKPQLSKSESAKEK
jgi:putative oxidoreductase